MGHTMPGNPFEKDADDNRNDPPFRLVDAILALAYEQHTANLIDLERMENERAAHGGLRISMYGEIIRQRMDARGYDRKGI